MKKLAIALSVICCAVSLFAKQELYPVGEITPVTDFQSKISWDLSKSYTENSGCRSRISLNQYWKFLPCEINAAIPAPQADWGYFLVPGYWRSSGLGNAMRNKDGFAVKKYNGKPVADYPAAWYMRTFTVPEKFKGMNVRLYFELFYTEMELFINGKPVNVKQSIVPRFHVDITDFLNYGAENTIYLKAKISSEKKYIRRGGIRGNLFLEARPAKHFGEPAINTSVRQKNIFLEFHNANLDEKANLLLTGKIRDAQTGKTVFEFRQPYKQQMALNYITPKLWSPESPALYWLELAVTDQNKKQLDAKAVRFGFREFWVDNGNYLLNGKPVTLITDTSWPTWWTPIWNLEKGFVKRAFQTLKKMNVNSLYGRPLLAPDAFFDTADEEGILIIYTLHNLRSNIHKTSPSVYIKEYDQVLNTLRDARSFINHPSHIGILVDVWYNYHKGTVNPAFIGLRADADGRQEPDANGNFTRKPGTDPNLKVERVIVKKSTIDALAKISRKHFPHLEVFTGADGHIGNIYGTHIYHTWKAPLAELSALFSRYSREKNIPVFAGEMNIPFAASFSDIRSYPNKQPLFKENAARLLGNRAYGLKGIYTTYAYSDPLNDFLAGMKNFEKSDNSEYYFLGELYGLPLQEYVEHTFFPWRYDGMNGIGVFEYVLTSRLVLAARSYPPINFLNTDLSKPGAKAEFQHGTHHRPVFSLTESELLLRPNPVTIPYLKGTAPLTANFAGTGKDRYEIDHAFFENEILQKQVAVINQTPAAVSYKIKAELLDSRNKSLARTVFTCQIPPFTNKSFPFQLKLPPTDSRREFKLKATLLPQNEKSAKLECSMQIELFPRLDVNRNNGIKVHIFGGTPEFIRAVEKSGFSVIKVNDLKNVPPHALLIFAAHSLEEKEYQKYFKELLGREVKLLVMEQTAKASPELIKVRCRKAFRNAGAHPVTAGFKDEDFANWRGSSSTVPGYEKIQAENQWQDWGSRNMVAAHTFRRPAHGNYIPLLVSGFDLFQTPLLEYSDSKNIWIASQLEITPRLSIDPVATHLFSRMINYLENWKPGECRTAFIGGPKGKQLLDKMLFSYRQLPLKTGCDFSYYQTLIISDPDWQLLRKFAFELANFVYNGGNILYLHTGNAFSANWLPFIVDMGTVEKTRHAVIQGQPDLIWRHGFDANDLYFHNERTLPVFTNFPKSADAVDPAVLMRSKYGSGNYIFCSLKPEDFGNTPAKGKVSRLLSAIATSLGINIGSGAISPYEYHTRINRDLSREAWSFAKDPGDTGFAEKWHLGKGTPPWISGQTTVSGERVRAGIAWKRFLEEDYRGIAWYKLEFDLTAEEANADNLKLWCYHLYSKDKMYLNGKGIGSYAKAGAHRGYVLKKQWLKVGKNVLFIRIEDQSGKGGLTGGVYLKSSSGNARLWATPYPEGSERDYSYPADMLRMY